MGANHRWKGFGAEPLLSDKKDFIGAPPFCFIGGIRASIVRMRGRERERIWGGAVIE